MLQHKACLFQKSLSDTSCFPAPVGQAWASAPSWLRPRLTLPVDSECRLYSQSPRLWILLPGATNPRFSNCQLTADLSEPGFLCHMGLTTGPTSEGCWKAYKVLGLVWSTEGAVARLPRKRGQLAHPASHTQWMNKGADSFTYFILKKTNQGIFFKFSGSQMPNSNFLSRTQECISASTSPFLLFRGPHP